MNIRPKRKLLVFDCPNDKEYCFLQRKVDGVKKCVTHKKAIHFTCRFIQNIEAKSE